MKLNFRPSKTEFYWVERSTELEVFLARSIPKSKLFKKLKTGAKILVSHLSTTKYFLLILSTIPNMVGVGILFDLFKN